LQLRSRLFAIIFSLILACLIAASIASLNAFSTALTLEITRHLEDYTVNWINEIAEDNFDKVKETRFLTNQISNIINSNLTDEQKNSFVTDLQRSTNSNITVLIREGNKTTFFGMDRQSTIVHTFESNFLNKTKAFNTGAEIPQTFIRNGKLWLTLWVPVYNKNGNSIGDFTVNYPIPSLLGNSPVGLQTDLKFDLLFRNGTSIFSNYNGDNQTGANSLSNQPIFQKITESKSRVESGIFPNANDTGGNSIFVAARQPSLPGFPDAGWVLTTSIPTEKAFSGVLNLRVTFVVITVLILAISLLVVYFVSRSISKPIMALRDSAQKITEGDLGTKIELKSTDEIGQLANQLDNMRESIRSRTEEILNKDEKLQQINQSLLETEKSKDEFISMVSHELKTPIMPIKLYSDMLLKPEFMGELNQKQNKAIETISKSVERLQILINDMLDVHRLEIGRFNLSKTSVGVREMIDQIMTSMLPIAQAKNIELVSQTMAGGNIICDPHRIEQVIFNLVKNAVDFVPEDHGKITVSVENFEHEKINADSSSNVAEQPDSYLLFAVEDNGIGLPPGKSDDLFKKFYQIDTTVSRKHGGTGLGLAICKGIVEAHGGKIWFDKEYTEGTRFKFIIPRGNEGPIDR
jgi:signal transduction histidine kinase